MISSFNWPLIPALFSFGSKEDHFSKIDNVKGLIEKIRPEDNQFTFWRTHKEQVKEYVKNYQNQQDLLQPFEDFITELLTQNPDPYYIKELFELTIDSFDMNLLLKFAQVRANSNDNTFDDIVDLASRNIYFDEAIRDHTWKQQLYLEGRKIRAEVLYFLPNLINTFLGVFSLINGQKNFSTLWDKYLALSIVAKFFEIPFLMAKLIQPFMGVATQIYVITAVVLASLAILLAVYKKFFEPVPLDIPSCENMDLKADCGELSPLVGTIKELNPLLSHLLGGRNVVLVGHTGTGKTSLIEHLTLLKQQKLLPQEIEKRTIERIKCSEFVSNFANDFAELIKRIRSHSEAFQTSLLFILDEYDQLCANKSAFQAFKNEILDKLPGALFVAITTPARYQEIANLDTDGSIRSRLEPIFIEDETSKVFLNPLKAKFEHLIPIEQGAIDRVIQLSTSDKILAEGGARRMADSLFRSAISDCLNSYDPKFSPESLREVNKKIDDLPAVTSKNGAEVTKKYLELKKQRIEIESQLKDWKEKTSRIRKVLILQKEYLNRYMDLGQRIMKVGDLLEEPLDLVRKHIPERDQKMFLFLDTFRMPIFEKVIEDLVGKLDGKLGPTKVDEALVIKTHVESKKNMNLCSLGNPKNE